MGEVWETKCKNMGNEKPGHRAHTARETNRWHMWEEIAKTEFVMV